MFLETRKISGKKGCINKWKRKIPVKSIILLLWFVFNIAQPCFSKVPDSVYLIRLNYPGFGQMNFFLHVKINSDTDFFAYTDPGLLKNILPFYKCLYLRIKYGKYYGSALKIRGKIKDGSHFSGNASTIFGHFGFSATVSNDSIYGTLKKNTVVLDYSGNLQSGASKNNIPFADWYDSFKDVLNENIYDQRILERKDWVAFLKSMKKSTHKAQDDLDIFIPFVYFSHRLHTSHVYLTKKDPFASDANESDIKIRQISDSILLLKINRFNLVDTTAIDSVFGRYKNIENLIVDVRDCAGGDFSSMILTGHFIHDSFAAGYFLGNKYYAKTTHLPSKKYLDSIPSFNGKTVNDFFRELGKAGILKATAFPKKPYMKGNVFILTDSNTMSAAEPFVYFIKSNKLGTIIGTNTAGKMLAARSFKFYGNWYVSLPVANYFTYDNVVLDQTGISPDIQVPSSQALNKAIEIIRLPGLKK